MPRRPERPADQRNCGFEIAGRGRGEPALRRERRDDNHGTPVSISLLGIINATAMMAPCVMFGLARDGLFAPQAARVSAGGTPYVALLITAIAAAGLAFAGTFETLFAIAAFMGVAIDGSVFVSRLIVLRRREPEMRRPFRAIGYPVIPMIVAGASSTPGSVRLRQYAEQPDLAVDHRGQLSAVHNRSEADGEGIRECRGRLQMKKAALSSGLSQFSAVVTRP